MLHRTHTPVLPVARTHDAARYTDVLNLNGTLMYYMLLVPEAFLEFALQRLIGMWLHNRPCARVCMRACASRYVLGAVVALLVALVLFAPLHGLAFPDASLSAVFAYTALAAALVLVPTVYMVMGHAVLCCARVRPGAWRRAERHVAETLAVHPSVRDGDGGGLAIADGDAVAAEVRWMADTLVAMARLARLRGHLGLGHVGCAWRRRRKALARQLRDLTARHRQLWPLRCRPGGVDSSCARFDFTVAALEGRHQDGGGGGCDWGCLGTRVRAACGGVVGAACCCWCCDCKS